MKRSRIAYLSLGSNIGKRIENIQKAVNLIARNVGQIQKIASVYKTDSWGFSGDYFYNTCIELTTHYNPEMVMEKLLSIENQMGRERKLDGHYSDRIIDIDILLFGDKISRSDRLVLPHPRMLERKFVLVPLAEMAKNKIHPLQNESISVCLENCTDTCQILRVTEKLKRPRTISEKYDFIVIEGNIGAGKTTLVNMLSADFNAKTVLERFADNPFLPKFYKNPRRHAFALEMSFLEDRHRQLSEKLTPADNLKSFVISDYYIFKSLIFAQINLLEDEYNLYRRLFNLMYKTITRPDLYVYLHRDNTELLKNIRKRGRAYEQNIRADYLQKIQQGYNDFIKNQQNIKTLVMDVSNLDFVLNPDDYQYIINKILS